VHEVDIRALEAPRALTNCLLDMTVIRGRSLFQSLSFIDPWQATERLKSSEYFSRSFVHLTLGEVKLSEGVHDLLVIRFELEMIFEVQPQPLPQPLEEQILESNMLREIDLYQSL